ncbi:MAG: sarcosine oxidase subunit gamma [Woeseiaceae bacterium]
MPEAIEVRADKGFVNLRGNLANAAFVRKTEAILEQPLPREANRLTENAHRIYWLAPDEWLVVTSLESTPGLCERLERSLAGMHAAVNDVSGGNAAIRLEGTHARRVLATGCTLDFHDSVFKPGHCAQSGIAKTNVLIGLLDPAPSFELIVRRSFANYLRRWLNHAA